MPTATYTAIASQTVSGSNITFSNLGSTGARDFIVVIAAGGTGGIVPVSVRLNGDTGNNYYGLNLWASNTTFGSGSYGQDDKFTLEPAGRYLDGRGDMVLHFLDASTTDKHKVMVSRVNYPNGSYKAMVLNSHRWASTAAITQINLIVSASATITASIYGVIA